MEDAVACNFVAEIKEGEPDQPCFLFLNSREDTGLGGKSLYLHLPDGTGMAEAKELRDALHKSGAKLRLG